MKSIKIARRVSAAFMTSMLAAVLLTAFVATVSAQTGNTNAQEVGDAIYRETGLGYDHAGIYYRYTGDNPNDRSNHRIIHIPGLGHSVESDTLANFIGSHTYYGAHTVGSLSYPQRQNIITTAEALRDDNTIGYTWNDALEWEGSDWEGTVSDIDNIRCDGVVEFCYEKNGIMVWGKNQNHYDITYSKAYCEEHNNMPDPPNDPNTELSPKAQRGGFGPQYTNMIASSPQNPTKVSNLHSTSHNNAIGQWNDPQSRDNTIEVAWTDATDAQSGLWGYYVKWDNMQATEPTPDPEDWTKNRIKPGVKKATSPELEDGDNWYFHIRSVDKAGNWEGSTAHIGPFYIDTTPPTAPVISSSTHPNEDIWYCNRDPAFTWTTPTDLSGIACYSYTIDHSSTTTPDETCDTTENSKSYTGLAYSTWYFHVRAKDNACNWGPADHFRVQIENCDDKDGCYAYGNGCEDRDYYCSGGSLERVIT
jgi:hypothetical protein